MIKLGNIYYYGQGAPQDYAEAISWYRKAADRQDAEAMNFLAHLYAIGRGVPEDCDKAREWLEKAAAAKSDLAKKYLESGLGGECQVTTGMLARLFAGDPCGSGDDPVKKAKTAYNAKDYGLAMRCYRQAAEKGDVQAMNMIADMYQSGRGAPCDFKEAMRWFRQAADKGNSHAMWRVGSMYALGEGVTEDDGERMRWWRKAADIGDSDLKYRIGAMYAMGFVVAKDCTVAREWLSRAAAAGDNAASDKLRTGFDGECEW
jgi:TPR repeat protein